VLDRAELMRADDCAWSELRPLFPQVPAMLEGCRTMRPTCSFSQSELGEKEEPIHQSSGRASHGRADEASGQSSGDAIGGEESVH
jgi:hypothetical protein